MFGQEKKLERPHFGKCPQHGISLWTEEQNVDIQNAW